MSFLESIQHGLEKASQEAARITKIQHLHNIVNDLTFKASEQGQALLAQAMDMYRNGHLGQGELVVICQQIATYQQQINEVNAELQRLHEPESNVEQQAAPPAGYPANQQAAPTPAYAAPTAALPAQPYYPAPSSESPTKRAETSQDAQANVSSSSETPTKPAEKKHVAVHKAASTELPAEAEPAPTTAPGSSYAHGSLPPIYSPFTAHPAPAVETAEAEPEKPSKVRHSTKKSVTVPEEGK
ncbi:MAG: hypothetical protein ABI234_05075 [Ktedonobacteraceae bacterium]